MNAKKLTPAKPGLPQEPETLHGMRVVVGNIGCCPPPETKTSGIKVRGGKAQTKGMMARGPMA